MGLSFRTCNKDVDENSSLLDKWLYLLKNLSRLNDRPQALTDRIFSRFLKTAQVAALPSVEQEIYIKSMTTENDLRNQMAFAKKQGLEQGLEQGKEQAIRAKVIAFKQQGVSLEIIATAVNMSVKEVVEIS